MSATTKPPQLAPITTETRPAQRQSSPSSATGLERNPTREAGSSRFLASSSQNSPQLVQSFDSPLTYLRSPHTPQPGSRRSSAYDSSFAPYRRSSLNTTVPHSATAATSPHDIRMQPSASDEAALEAFGLKNVLSRYNIGSTIDSATTAEPTMQHEPPAVQPVPPLSSGPSRLEPTRRPVSTLEPSRRPMSMLVPREATHTPSYLLPPPVPGSQSTDSPSQTHNASHLRVPGLPNGSTHAGMTAWQFLDSDATIGRAGQTKRSATAPTTARENMSKQRAEVPIMELRITPITDTINMFGSTQSSSNYSLSGTVVVRVHNVIRQVKPRSPTMRRKSSAAGVEAEEERESLWLPEISTGSTFMDPEELFASHADVNEDGDYSNDTAHVREINVQSLSCTFSGYALYVDHSGRFAACRLADVTEELLPQGFKVSIPPLGKSQEYEIEFNMSIPGWLPGTLLTRFGGTFYSLEARAKYTAVDSEQQHAIPSSLVPPRRGSMQPPDSMGGDIASDPEQIAVPLHWQSANRTHLSDEEGSRNRGAHAKHRAESMPPAALSVPTTTTKSTWLSKRAKQLSLKTRLVAANGASTSAPSPAPSHPSPVPPDEIASQPDGAMQMPPNLYASRDHIRAFSDPIVIVVRRCREVVPVPVARMAIVGTDGSADGPIQDPPADARLALGDETQASGVSEDADDGESPQVAQSTSPSLATLPTQDLFPGPPVAPAAFNLPNDPAKAAAQIASHAAATSLPRPPSAPPPRTTSSAPNETTGPSLPGVSPAVPMRHFLHRPMLHPPAEAEIPNVENGLPFSLTLSLPSYVTVDGTDSDILNFGVQIEVGRSSIWSRVRELGGLRLRDMELSCIQTERHCSVPSRTFCHAYPLPPDPRVSPFDLPVFPLPPSVAPGGRTMSSAEVRQRRGYDRMAVQHHMELLQAGTAPHPAANNVERLRTVVVGPPPSAGKHRTTSSGGKQNGESGGSGSRGKDREGSSKTANRKSVAPSASQPSDMVASGSMPPQPAMPAAGSLPRRMESEVFSPEDMPNEAGGSRRSTGRGRRAYQSAMRGLSNFATAVMDISFDLEGTGYNSSPEHDGRAQGSADDARRANHGRRSAGGGGAGSGSDASRAALYSFAGSDGHGVDLTRGRVRMAIKLPLVTSSASRARAAGTPQLVPDFESPFTKTRHKLQVKLGFGFGSKPLGGEGQWGQSLVMCVPVRFTNSAPREVREQFAPMPIQQVAMDSANVRRASEGELLNEAGAPTTSVALATSPGLPTASSVLAGIGHVAVPSEAHMAPVLPSYNQLFREDGSRLADEGEDLPQYPGPRVPPPSGGSVTGPATNEDGQDGAEQLSSSRNNSVVTETGVPPLPLIGAVRRPSTSNGAGPSIGNLSMSQRSSSLPGSSNLAAAAAADGSNNAVDSTIRMAMPDRMYSYDNRIAPSHVLDESIPADKRRNMSRAMHLEELADMRRDEQEVARQIRRISSHMDQQAGVQVSTEHVRSRTNDDNITATGGDSGQETDAVDELLSDLRLTGETVNVDDVEDAFDDDVPAFAARPRQDRLDVTTTEVQSSSSSPGRGSPS